MTRRPSSITIAAAAYAPERLPDLAAWRSKLERWLGDAHDLGADLAVFPEYAAMELAPTTGEGAERDVSRALAAVARQMPAADAIHQELARRFGLHLVAGSGPARGSDGRYHNVARLITPDGRLGRQAKSMLTPWERAWGLAPGRRLRVFETALGRIAIAVCYDSEFPLNVRAQCEAGAELVAVPACTDAMTGYSRVRTAALARALENQCATVASPLSGRADWCPAIDVNVGAAGLYGPADRGVSDNGIIAEGSLDATGWTVATVDVDAIRETRLTGEVRTFSHWTEQAGARALAPFVEVVDLT